MSTGDAAQSNALSSKLATSLEGRELESGFTILTSKVTAVIPKTVVNEEEASQSTNLGLILGIAIPLTIISNYLYNVSCHWHYSHNFQVEKEKRRLRLRQVLFQLRCICQRKLKAYAEVLRIVR
jgi:hypothetical protein